MAKQRGAQRYGQRNRNPTTSTNSDTNTRPSAHAGKSQSEPSKLLEAHDVEQLDNGTQSAAGATYQDVENVGALKRPLEGRSASNNARNCPSVERAARDIGLLRVAEGGIGSALTRAPSKMPQPQHSGRGRRMGLAIVHVVGALSVSFGFTLLILWVGVWEQKRARKRRLQDASIALGVPATSLETDDSLIPRIVQYSSQRFSAELLRNRLSDLCGALRTAWGLLGTLLQVGVVAAVGWAMYVDGAQNAAYMWCMLAVAVFFWLASVGFSLLCLVLTGRYPGEAKAARKSIAVVIEQRHAAEARNAGQNFGAAADSNY